MEPQSSFTAFAGQTKLASGPLKTMLTQVKAFLDEGGTERVLIFHDGTGTQTEFDLRGSLEEVLARAGQDPAFLPADPTARIEPRPGRPKLGVVSREVSLLPRHWQWLDRQPNGASAALRRLIESASKLGAVAEQARIAREAAAKFMWIMAGNLPDFEEASRALYAKDDARVKALTKRWPADIRDHLVALLESAAELDVRAKTNAAQQSG